MVRKKEIRRLSVIALSAGLLCLSSLFQGTSWAQGLSGICSVGTRVFSALDYSLASLTSAGGNRSPQVDALIQSGAQTPDEIAALGYFVPSRFLSGPVCRPSDGPGCPNPVGSGVSAGPLGSAQFVPFASLPLSGFSLPTPPSFNPPTPNPLR